MWKEAKKEIRAHLEDYFNYLEKEKSEEFTHKSHHLEGIMNIVFKAFDGKITIESSETFQLECTDCDELLEE